LSRHSDLCSWLSHFAREFFLQRFRRNIVDGTGGALHLKAAFAEKIEEFSVLHSDLFGKLIDSYAHAIGLTVACCEV